MRTIYTLAMMILFGFSAYAGDTKTATVNMNSYLEQVKKNNPAYKATQEASDGAKLRSTEGDLLTLPQLTLDVSKKVDETEPTSVAGGTKNEQEIYTASISQNTSFGLSGALSYGNAYFLTEGASGFLTPPYDQGYYRASPSIELKQSLWRNGFGSETRAQRNAANAQAQASLYAERAKNLGVILEAKGTYYKLYYAQKTVQALKESLDTAGKLQAWAKKRLNQGLGEQSDFYQTKAAYELREFEYLTAQEEQKSAARAFNSLKGENSDVVTETLQEEPLSNFKKLTYSEKIWSDETRAASKAADAAKANNLFTRERSRPSLDLYGKYAWTGLDHNQTTAQNESFHDDHPAYLIGIKFSTPLAFGKANDVTNGYEKEALAADLDFKRKSQEQERDYMDLVSKIENANLKLKLATTLEESQKIKAQAERVRHGKGRTTFFQVLTFEQEYLAAQLNKIKTEAELNTLLTQFQVYRGE